MLEVEFPSGERVVVTLRNFVPAEPAVDPYGGLAEAYPGLVEAAESGDAASARVLYRMLTECTNSFRDEAAMNAAIATLHETGELVYPEGARIRSGDVARGVDTSLYEESIRQRFALCKGVTDEQIATAPQWLAAASAGGDFLAMRYLARAEGHRSEKSVEIYRELWERGHLSAGDTLGIFYKLGIPSETDGRPDYVRSYAYSLVDAKVREAACARNDTLSPGARNYLQILQESLAQKSGFLTPQEQAEAEALTVELLRDNENCCLGSWHDH